MNNFYITHNIFIKDKKYFFENEKDNTIIKLNKKNWFKYLTEYGWERLCINWRKRLKETNKSCFGILDCGSNGDCLFHVLSDALNSKFILNNNEPLYDYENLRLIASKEINSDNFELILNSYKLEKELNEFNGEWDPASINSIEDLQRQIHKCGDNFWGDLFFNEDYDPENEAGIIFETDIFGEAVWRENAGIILRKIGGF